MTQDGQRASFSSRFGYILAVSASAVGVGNLWRFPYEVSHNGGGIFVIIYLAMAFTFGICLMMMESAYGRRTGKSGIAAFMKLPKRYKSIGYLTTIVPILMVSYYCVIGGWVLKWLFETVTGNLSALTDEPDYWFDFIAGDLPGGFGEPMLWFVIFGLLCILCIRMGLKSGIEKVSKFVMPALLVIMVAMIIYEMISVDGIMDGIEYYLNPDPGELGPNTFLSAASQVFFSLSLATGVLITYGSYAAKDVDIERSSASVVTIDSMVAMMAGLMIIPVAFLAGFTESSGMGLMFTALPQIFESMPGGVVIAPVFYLLVFFAAITSAASLAEAGVSSISDVGKIGRKRSIGFVLAVILAIGTVCTLGFGGGPLAIDGPLDRGAGWLGVFDTLTNSILMPISAILMCLMVGHYLKTGYVEDEIAISSRFRLRRVFRCMVMYVAPILLSLVLVIGLVGMFIG